MPLFFTITLFSRPYCFQSNFFLSLLSLYYYFVVSNVCPRSSYPFCIVTYYINRITSSWTYRSLYLPLFPLYTLISNPLPSSLPSATECPKIYRKSVLHLLKYTANPYCGRICDKYGTLSSCVNLVMESYKTYLGRWDICPFKICRFF